MHKSEIDKLLEEYWNGETTLEEEQRLSAYFHSHEVHPDHTAYASMFGFFKLEKENGACSLDIDSIEFESPDKRRGFGYFNMSPWTMGIAASFLILLTYFFGFDVSERVQDIQYTNTVKVYDEDAEMQEAYEITKEALALLSGKLKSGQKRVSKNLNEFDKVNLLN